ncbi:MAG TPA: T9SS type A sorting domain-containing protein [Xanthomarina sp.]|nr:T9SS type A sorting domain-containing protein [Xanthomarina sp.]
MKTKLPFLFMLFTVFTFGQTPINSFYSLPESSFAVVTSSTAVDQSASGANLTWNFTNLSPVDTSLDTYSNPSSGELITYPGTTSVLTITENVTGASSKIFSRNVAGQVSLTAAESAGLLLNYASNNAVIGTFPLNYNSPNSDAVAGTFNFDTYTGAFSGTINTIADAYGTLNINDLGEGAYSGAVTRLKIVQNLNLTYMIPNVGTVEQISYYYYDANDGTLIFRTSTVHVLVSLAGINETTTIMESFLSSPLSISNNQVTSTDIKLIPNPVEDVVNISINQNNPIRYATITDISGRRILTINESFASISVSNLQAGIYIANITTDNGVYTKKFLKK